MRTPSRREATSPAPASMRSWAEVLDTFICAVSARSSTLRSPCASRSSSSSRAGLASALPTRANCPNRAILRSCSLTAGIPPMYFGLLYHGRRAGHAEPGTREPLPAGGSVSYARDHLVPLVDEGLGNSAYLADLGDGRALAVDASRDLRALREA